MQETTLSKQKNRVEVEGNVTTTVSSEIDKVVVGSIAAFAGLVGLWSIVCLGSAMFQAGGPLQLFKGWFSALSGM